jgi:Group II intron, maturase-specific domain
MMQVAPGTIRSAASTFSAIRLGHARRTAGGRHSVSFLPAVRNKAAKRMRQSVRRWRLHRRHDLGLQDIADWVRPILSGWVRYYVGSIPLSFASNSARLMPSSCAGRFASTNGSEATRKRCGMVAFAQAAQPQPVRSLERSEPAVG